MPDQTTARTDTPQHTTTYTAPLATITFGRTVQLSLCFLLSLAEFLSSCYTPLVSPMFLFGVIAHSSLPLARLKPLTESHRGSYEMSSESHLTHSIESWTLAFVMHSVPGDTVLVKSLDTPSRLVFFFDRSLFCIVHMCNLWKGFLTKE